MSKIDTMTRPATRNEIRAYVLEMVSELSGLAQAYGDDELAEALKRVGAVPAAPLADRHV